MTVCPVQLILISDIDILHTCTNPYLSRFFFFFNDTATTEIYTSIELFPTRRSSDLCGAPAGGVAVPSALIVVGPAAGRSEEHTSELQSPIDISYAVFCLKKKKKK